MKFEYRGRVTIDGGPEFLVCLEDLEGPRPAFYDTPFYPAYSKSRPYPPDYLDKVIEREFGRDCNLKISIESIDD